MATPLFQVDAFTGTPFRGNPAAVCLLARPREPAWMQEVAAEMNLSETAFLAEQGDGFELRWFTPTTEVDLCGHATLASAHVLWECGRKPATQKLRFYTRSGLLGAERKPEGIELNFPAEPARPASAPPELARALGVAPRFVGKNRFDFLVEVDSEEALRQLNPDHALLARVTPRGVIVTSRASSVPYDFVSRFFAPAAGINEDPVTGSAHCCLGPYWKERLGKEEFSAYQASKRGGTIRVRVAGPRVFLTGQAVTVLRGELLP